MPCLPYRSHESLKHHFAHALEVVHHVTHTPLTVEPCPRPSKRQPFVTTKGFALGGMFRAFPKGPHRARFGPVTLFYVFEKIHVSDRSTGKTCAAKVSSGQETVDILHTHVWLVRPL